MLCNLEFLCLVRFYGIIETSAIRITSVIRPMVKMQKIDGT